MAKSCPTLCSPMDCSPPGSSVYVIFLARILEWVAISFCRGSSPPRDWTWASCFAGRFLISFVLTLFIYIYFCTRSLLLYTGFSLTAVGSLVDHNLVAAGGLGVLAYRCCPEACGVFPHQGLNLCPLPWQLDSLPLDHQGSSYIGCLISIIQTKILEQFLVIT